MFWSTQFHNLIFGMILAECSGGSWNETNNCCTSESPCNLGQGDCDNDGECEGNLVCGNNNCGDNFLWESADCCIVDQGWI